MRILYLSWGDYPKFLQWHYGSHPLLKTAGYQEQLEARADSLFGTMNAYSRNFTAHGHNAADFFVNNFYMQAAWAREHGLPVPPQQGHEDLGGMDSRLIHTLKTALRPYRNSLRALAGRLRLVPQLNDFLATTLRAQIEDFRPDLVINDNIEMIAGKLIRESAPRHCFIIGQHGLDPPKGIDLSSYDLMISILDWVIALFRQNGVKAERVDGAFETSILERLRTPSVLRDIPVSFIGGLGADHGARQKMLEALAERQPLQIWGPPLHHLPPNSPLHRCYRGEAWGREMYDIHRRSKIALNSHVGAARGEPVNMRLYEATGVGAFLLSDNVHNGNGVHAFVPGRHLEGYRSLHECLEKIDYYLAHDEDREKIATAGQAHTLAFNTYDQRTAEILDLMARHGR